MADSFITVPPDSTGKSLDTRTAPDGNHREVVVVGDPATADVALVDAANGLDVDVTRLPALAAGTNNIGDVDVLTVPAPLSTTGGGTEATAHRVTIASDSTGVLSVDDNGGSLTVDGTVALSGTVDTELPAAAALADNAANPTAPAVGSFGMVWDGAAWDRLAGTSADGALVNLGGNNDVSLNAGTNNIGDVDVLTVPAPLSTTGGGTEAAALRVTVANDSTGVLSVDDNGGSLTVDGTVAVTGVSTLAEQQTQTTHLATIAGDTTAIETAIQILDDWDESDRAKVNPIAGQAGVQGASGTVTALTQRVVLATDVALPTGTNSIGQVTANAGTNLNTSTLALESGGNLATAVASLSVLDDWDETDRAKVNPIVGQAGIAAGAGATGATVTRTVTANGDGKTILSAGGSAASSGNNTLVAAGSNRLKVMAFSLTTLSTTAMTCIFQSGASGTELWRVVIQAPTGVSAGANLSTTVPGWLFATASATLLNLNLSSANAVHWSVSYYDEA